MFLILFPYDSYDCHVFIHSFKICIEALLRFYAILGTEIIVPPLMELRIMVKGDGWINVMKRIAKRKRKMQ